MPIPISPVRDEVTQDVLNDSVCTLNLTVSLRIARSRHIPSDTQAESSGLVESTVDLRTSIRYFNNSRKSLMLNYMLKSHVGPINKIRLSIARRSTHVLSQLIYRDSNSIIAFGCERQTNT